MSKNIESKKTIVAGLQDKFSRAKTVVLVDYRGLTVAEDTELRNQLRKAGVEYAVIKNTMINLAIEGRGIDEMKAHLEGPTAVAFAYDDMIAPAKILSEFAKKSKKLTIKCGACDCFGLKRSQLLAIYDAVMESVAASRRNNVEGQMGLFGMMEGDDAPISDIHVPDLPELSAQERMSMERETTGLYLSGHPMDDYREQLKGTGVVPIGRILQSLEEHDDVYQDEQVVSIAGIASTK